VTGYLKLQTRSTILLERCNEGGHVEIWKDFVDLLYAILSSLSLAFGGNMGLAIAVISFAFRSALLPLTLHLAYRSLETQAALKKLAPQLSRIRNRYKDDPKRMWGETAKLHKRHGIKIVDMRSFLSVLIQAPLFLGLFSAVRRGLMQTSKFLWIKDLSKPDGILAVICASLIGLSAALAPTTTEHHKSATAILPALLTLIFLWRIAAGVGIYSFASGLVGLVQALLVRRRAAQIR
jgi:YidC/Oxa1 family membrane protein insertase